MLQIPAAWTSLDLMTWTTHSIYERYKSCSQSLTRFSPVCCPFPPLSPKLSLWTPYCPDPRPYFVLLSKMINLFSLRLISQTPLRPRQYPEIQIGSTFTDTIKPLCVTHTHTHTHTHTCLPACNDTVITVVQWYCLKTNGIGAHMHLA
jgi:hypothetical protein